MHVNNINPHTIHQPFGYYSHGVLTVEPNRLLVTSGQLGIDSHGTVPDSCYEQALLCFQAIKAVLEEAEMNPSTIPMIVPAAPASNPMIAVCQTPITIAV